MDFAEELFPTQSGEESTVPSCAVESRTEAHSAPGGVGTEREVGVDMTVPREEIVQELRKAEQAHELVSEVERRLAGGNTGLEEPLRQLERLGQSLPEADSIRLLIESAVGSARTRSPIKTGSEVANSRSAIGGEISSLRGTIQGIDARADL
jgi:hypothetical protein